jgi:hypothetical protein
MTDPSGDSFDALRLPAAGLAAPRGRRRSAVRVHRRLGQPCWLPADEVCRPRVRDRRQPGRRGRAVHARAAQPRPFSSDGGACAHRRYRLVRYHRRGYAGSEPSTARSASDGTSTTRSPSSTIWDRAPHVVGHSGSGVSRPARAWAPGRVRSLVLEERLSTASTRDGER